MATIREITTQWTLPSGGGHLTVMYFEAGIAVASQRTALQTFWTAIKNSLDSGASYVISTQGRELEDSTGTLVGSWTETSAKVGTGLNTGEPVADATQGLIQWRTASIIGGRFLRGRTFVPGLANTVEVNGNLQAATVTAFNTAANALIASAAGLVVWHRPIAGSGGSHDAVSTASTWTEFAVLRRRRA